MKTLSLSHEPRRDPEVPVTGGASASHTTARFRRHPRCILTCRQINHHVQPVVSTVDVPFELVPRKNRSSNISEAARAKSPVLGDVYVEMLGYFGRIQMLSVKSGGNRPRNEMVVYDEFLVRRQKLLLLYNCP